MKIALIRLSAMGDILHMLWHINAIKNAYPKAQIDFFVDERFFYLVNDLIWFDNVISLPMKKHPFKAIKQVLKLKHSYNISIDYQGRIKSALITNLLSVNSYGYSKNGLKEKFAFYFYKHHCDCDYFENVYTRSLELSKFALKINEFSVQDVLIYKNNKCDKINEFKDKNFILLHNGSSKESKMYPLENFIEICKNIDYEFYLSWGNEFELNRAKKIAQVCKNAKILPKLSLKELVFLTKYAKLVIGNDSGTTHLAVVTNIANITFLNENPKKPAKRFVKPSEKHFYFSYFKDASPQIVTELIKKVLK